MDKSQLKPVHLCACANLRQATRAITQFYEEALKPTGLRATQFTLLTAIATCEVVSMTRLADVLIMDRTTLTRNLKPLKKEGLIETVLGEDRRKRLVSLTPKGEAALENALPLWEVAQTRVVEVLGQQQFANFLQELTSVVSLTRKE